jgi:hypothetical protein
MGYAGEDRLRDRRILALAVVALLFAGSLIVLVGGPGDTAGGRQRPRLRR